MYVVCNITIYLIIVYCTDVSLIIPWQHVEKENENNLGVACAWQYKANERSYAVQGHYYETVAMRK